MNKEQAQVQEMHEAFKHPVAETPTLVDAEVATLRYRLMGEELGEYVQAAADGDLVEIADALADLLVTVYGTAVVHGIDLESIFDIVMNSNMSKLDENGHPVPHAYIPGKFGKSDLYWEPQGKIKNELEVQGYEA